MLCVDVDFVFDSATCRSDSASSSSQKDRPALAWQQTPEFVQLCCDLASFCTTLPGIAASKSLFSRSSA